MTQEQLLAELQDIKVEDLYDILVLNGVYLPKQNCGWLTKAVMIKIATNETFCPSYAMVRVRPCVRLPTKQVLLQ